MLTNTGVACEFLDLFPKETFTHPFEVNNGHIRLPKIFGTGVYFADDTIKKYKLT